MNVPSHWWPDFDGIEDNSGTIAAVNFTQTKQRYFQILFDGDEGKDAYYSMRYYAVFAFVDVNQPLFSSFRLPSHPIPNPEGEEIHVCRRVLQIQADDDTASTNSNNYCSDSDNDGSDSGKDIDNEIKSDNVYMITDPNDWTILENGATGRTNAPIPFTGDDEEFSVDIYDYDIWKLFDEHGDIRFTNVLEWSLPRYGEFDQILFDWQATRMQNYMIYIIKHKAWKPKFYNPSAGVVITDDHVGRFHGVMLDRMVTRNRSIDEIWSTRHAFSANGPIKESMTQDAFKDLRRCLHFADDWEEDDERCNEVYEHEKEAAPDNKANHCQNSGVLEDGYNRQ